jgi:hypothetical protein
VQGGSEFGGPLLGGDGEFTVVGDPGGTLLEFGVEPVPGAGFGRLVEPDSPLLSAPMAC